MSEENPRQANSQEIKQIKKRIRLVKDEEAK